MQSKKELQEENATLIKENEEYAADISTLEREKLSLMDKCDKLSHELDNKRTACAEYEATKRQEEKEIRRLNDKLLNLTNVETVLARLEENLKTPNKLLEDKNRELTERVQQLEYENQSLRANIDTFNQSMRNTGYLEGKIEAYERMLISSHIVTADDGSAQEYRFTDKI